MKNVALWLSLAVLMGCQTGPAAPPTGCVIWSEPPLAGEIDKMSVSHLRWHHEIATAADEVCR